MKFNSPKKYSGAAALLFLLIFPGLFAVFVWGVEGARILQSDARLKDATESAALAVSTQIDVTEPLCDELTKAFLNGYFPTATVEASESPCVNTEKPNEFQINASITEKTWFPNSNIASYGTSFSVSNGMKVTKKIEPVDVVLVVNYASTMLGYKDDLPEIVKKIADKLSLSQSNKLGVVGFDHYVVSYQEDPFSNKKRLRLDHNLVCNDSFFLSENCIIFGGVFKNTSDWIEAATGIDINPNDFSTLLGAVSETALFGHSFFTNSVDFDGSVNGIFLEKNRSTSLIDALVNYSRNAIKSLKSPWHDHSTYSTLPLTRDLESIKESIESKDYFEIEDKKKNFSSSVKGASHIGLIGGARLAAEGSNKRRLIILITDGKEESYYATKGLVDAGLCEKIRSHFNDQSVSVELAIIGLNYNENSGAAMKRCIGSSNTYAYTGNSDTDSAMLDKLLNINSKNVGRLIN